MAGRPTVIINWEEIDKKLEAGCLGTEVAAYIGCHPNTLYQQCEKKYGCNFSEYAQEKKAKGDAILRMVQYKNAIKGNTNMLIWLGKNRLGQRNEDDLQKNTVPNDEVIEYQKKIIELQNKLMENGIEFK